LFVFFVVQPANILINYQGEVKLSDFGIVRKLSRKESDEALGGVGQYGGNGLVRDPGDGMVVDPGASDGGESACGAGLERLKSAHTFVGTVRGTWARVLAR
jgi:serine/threonine protein kinase